MARAWGVDLEAQGNICSDVMHYAALLDDHRKKFAQETLVKDFLTDEEKVHVVGGIRIDEARMAEYPPGLVAVRAIADVRQVHKLKEVMWPELTKQDLHRVRQLEDECIYPTCEMEWNGSLIDVELLHQWTDEVEQERQRLLWKIWRQTSIKLNPDAPSDWQKLFEHLGLPITEFTEQGAPSFTGAYLKRIEHPIIQMGLRASRLGDLMQRYFTKYSKTVGADGILRYALHQLRSDEGGTISGRYSSSAITIGKESIGGNIQQVMSPEKQAADYGPDYIVRKLFIAAPGHQYLGADAMQIEFRILADRMKTRKILAEYEADWENWRNPQPDYEPRSFHKFIHRELLPLKPDLLYKPTKNLNFATIYGAGLVKQAVMMEFITENEGERLKREFAPNPVPRTHPKLAKALEVAALYEREIPEVKRLLRGASELAKERGYVKTAMGRRARFPNGWRSHKALNAVIQGTAGEYNKLMLIELHRERKDTGLLMRVTNHDEVTGDCPDAESERKVKAILHRQLMPEMKIPILWDCRTGANWAECH